MAYMHLCYAYCFKRGAVFAKVELFFAFLGRPIVQACGLFDALGRFILFFGYLFTHRLRLRLKQTLEQLVKIGFGSMGVIALTALFTGMVEAIQLYSGFHQFGIEGFMGYTIFLSITKELGPVFAALMVIARSISAMAAELGAMRVSQQIDAIDIMGVDSKHYLITPRIIATAISLPLLIIWFDMLSISSAYFISVYALDVNATQYLEKIAQFGTLQDIFVGVIKGVVFGIVCASIGSYFGYNANHGAKGVGDATITAVVSASIMVFITNYLLSALFLMLGL